MSSPSTNAQTFSCFVALNRADRTHEPKESGKTWIGKLVVAGVILAVALRLIFAGL